MQFSTRSRRPTSTWRKHSTSSSASSSSRVIYIEMTDHNQNSSSSSSHPKKWYAPSTYSKSSKQALLPSEMPPKTSKSQKAWKKTKKFLSTIGEPPTAEYDRQQVALGLKEDKNRTVKGVNYGAFNGGGPYNSRI